MMASPRDDQAARGSESGGGSDSFRERRAKAEGEGCQEERNK